MSWDVMFIKTGTNREPLGEIAEAADLGARQEVAERMKALFPALDCSNLSCLMLMGEDYGIEFNLGREEVVNTCSMYFHGDTEPTRLIQRICEEFDCRALDIQSTEFLNFEESSFDDWKTFRDRALKR